MARLLNNKTLKDRINTKDLLESVNMLSVNQLNAKIKVQEIWKSLNIKDYPLQVKRQEINNEMTNTRACHEGRIIKIGRKLSTQKACID